MPLPKADGMDPIAVVGMGCRFPGDASSPAALWDMLEKGESAWSEFPEDRVNISSYFHPSGNRQGSICFRGAHFLKQDVAAFDSSFFSIPADEAKAVDPQQRMLLEVAVEALDNAGIDRNALRKSETGVWVGSFVKDYEQIVLRDPDWAPIYGATGNGIAIMSNRISYFLDVNGPSMTIDTGCSASLVGVHNACQALRDGEIDCGLAGGAGLILTPNTMMPMTALNFLSPDGKCFTFDARANGYGRGEGIGIVVLKRLSDAIRDNDNIRAVIRGSRVNQDGRTPGITLPSAEAQIRNINGVYKRAGLDVNKTAYVECHGTGTQAGDVRELKAVSTALAKQRPIDKPIVVGSVKTNIGHLEGCAGIAGLIKGILTVEHGVIPQHINFEAPGNPTIDFEDWKVKVPVDNTPWPMDGLRRASINCFGFGGTNAHVVIDDTVHYLAERGLSAHHSTAIFDGTRDPSLSVKLVAETIAAIKHDTLEISKRTGGHNVPIRDMKTQLYVFSAHEQQSLSRMLQNQVSYIQDYLKSQQGIADPAFPEDLAYTLGCRRTKLQWRISIPAQDIDELIYKLQHTDKSNFVRASEDKIPNVAFVFGGQGAQWFAMGRELMAFDIFIHSIVAASDYMSRKLQCPFSLLAELLSDENSTKVDKAYIAQPATTAIQVALVDLLVQYYGVNPTSVVGHSSGEIAAAYATGAISRESAWEVAYRRGLCASSFEHDGVGSTKGRMLAVRLSEDNVQSYLEKMKGRRITIACVNSPKSVTLSGDGDAIMDIHAMLRDEGVLSTVLKVGIAYHSQDHMMHCAGEYCLSIANMTPREPVRRTITHPLTSGKAVSASNIDPGSVAADVLQPREIPTMFSSVTGKLIEWNRLDAAYWTANMVRPVLFSQAVTAMMHRDDGKKPDIILELGPKASLRGLIQEILQADPKIRRPPAYFSMLHYKKPATVTALQAVGELWSRGCNITMPWVITRNVSFRRPRLLADLPNYPWNHDTLYWHESHLSRANRFQVHGRYDLIGRPTADSLPSQPRWRGFLRTKESPWIEHHQVQKTTIYPAAGMVVMAIEGVKQIAEGSYAGIEVSQFRIEKAMIVPHSEHGLEYMLTMSKHGGETRRPGRGFSYSAGTSVPIVHEFHIYSKQLDGVWHEHGSGLVTIHRKPSPTSGMGYDQAVSEKALKAQQCYKDYLEAKEFCDELIIPRQLYETLDVIGMNYGRLFQNITSLQKRDNKCNFVVRVPDTKSVMPAGFEYPHTIHPTTLDSVFQTAFSLAGGDSMVPSYIGSIYISASPQLPSEAGAEVVGYAKAERGNVREATVSFVMSDGSWKNPKAQAKQEPLVIISDMTFTALTTSLDIEGGFLPNHQNLCSELVWEKAPVAEEVNIPSETKSPGPSSYPATKLEGGVFLLVPDFQSKSIRRLCNELSQRFMKCQLRTFASITADATNLPAYCISLLEIEDHSVWDWGHEDFAAFRILVSLTSGLFWVTRGAQLESMNPKAALFQALARTLHSEDPTKNLISYDMEESGELDVEKAADRIITLFSKSFAGPKHSGPMETEYAERKGQLMVSRLVPIKPLNRMIERGSAPPEPEFRYMDKEEGRALKLKVRELGKPESLYWAEDMRADLPLPSQQVKIKVLSAGLSALDIDIVLGRGRDNSLGTDVFGVIDSVSDDVHDLKEGDRVIAIVRGSFRTHVRCHEALVQKLPDDLTDPSLVVLPTSFAAADYALHNIARLGRNQTVLIHAGTGSFGQAAITLARSCGARIFTTVKNEDQRKLLRKYYELPDENILDGNNTSFTQSIMRLTRNEGANVIFDPIAEYHTLNRLCVAQAGHIVRFTKKYTGTGTGDGDDFTGKTFTDTVIDLPYLIKNEPLRMGKSLKFVCLKDSRVWLPLSPVKKYEYCYLPEAVSAFAADSQCGPTYCVVPGSKPIPMLPRNTHPAGEYLRSDGTYVLAGQGGLCMHIAKLLESHGVKHMALLSRSGAITEASRACIVFLKNRGVNVKVLKVDICGRGRLDEVFEEIQRTMPPIKGLFQCAAQIRDAVFDNMSFEDWEVAARPKTIGSLNLFEASPRDMDFVIFLSSSAGVIGSRGQANYAAGNVFQDALARHINTTTSMRSVSIDLGPVLGAGMLTEDPRTLDMLKASGFFGIRLQDFERIVERSITGFIDGETIMPPQVITGVGTGGLIRQNKPGDPYWTRTALFEHLNKVDMPPESETTLADGSDDVQCVELLLVQASDPDEAQDIVCQGLCQMLAQSMNMKAENVDENKQPSFYGVDSLVAVGVRNWIFRECKVDVSVFEVLSDSSIAELSRTVVEKGNFGSGEK